MSTHWDMKNRDIPDWIQRASVAQLHFGLGLDSELGGCGPLERVLIQLELDKRVREGRA